MSNLTIGLAALGGLSLAAVVAHGAWTARRAGPKRPAPSSDSREPTLDAPGVPGDAASGGENGTRRPPSDAPALNGDDGAPAVHSSPVRRSGPRIDPTIDALAVLALETPLSGDLLLAHGPSIRHAGTKPVALEGLDIETHTFELPVSGRRYSELQAGVQLTNRNGPLNEIEYSEFVQQLQAVADALGATVDLPDMLEVVARARALDAASSSCDAQLAVHLQARGAAWSTAYVQQQAARFGFTIGAVPGRMVLPSPEEGAPPVLLLSYDTQAALAGDAAAPIRDVILQFDVPYTDRTAAPFARWYSIAEALSASMDAALVDDLGTPLRAEAFAAIGRDLERLYDRLEAQGVPAGSATARRLFS